MWIPGPVPPRFWEDRAHRRDYLLWLAQRFDFRTLEDLYGLELTASFPRNYGGGLKKYWGQSALEAVQDCFPERDWKPWLFREVARGFWDLPANRRSYMAWLGQRLGYRCKDDWYAVGNRDFLRNKGAGLLKQHHGSAVRAVIDSIPGQEWCEWKFSQVPDGFWELAENRHRYLRWLGKELGFRRPKDWYRIQSRDFRRRRGGALLNKYSSFYDLMREFLPQLDWDRLDRHRPLRVEQVLAWADAHHSRHGKWPFAKSGKVPGTGETWSKINTCLQNGCRGLPGGISLARLLKKHRGVRVGQGPPKLSEKEILVWADAHFAARGKWPTRESGPIAGTRESWLSVHLALRTGDRGLRGGSSLPQFLSRRRGVRNRLRPPPLKEKQILAWALAYCKTTGRWPSVCSAPIAGSRGDTWISVDKALRSGRRGLPGGLSLAQLLRTHGLK